MADEEQELELEPCPSCGTPKPYGEWLPDDGMDYRISCLNHEACRFSIRHIGQGSAMDLWNALVARGKVAADPLAARDVEIAIAAVEDVRAALAEGDLLNADGYIDAALGRLRPALRRLQTVTR